jgi:hypothetical protein
MTERPPDAAFPLLSTDHAQLLRKRRARSHTDISTGAGHGTRNLPDRKIPEETVADPGANLPDGPPKCATLGARSKRFDQDEGRPESPRGALVAALTTTIAAATAAGDLHAARVAHEALGRLLAEPQRGAPAVPNLASERAKRGTRR